MAKVTKTNLIEKLLQQDDIASKAAATRIVDALFTDIKEQVIAGNDVDIAGFISLRPAVQAANPARKGHNPSTGAEMDIAATPAKKVVRFKVSAPFKTAIAAGYSLLYIN